jgi:hypothetical protein
MAEVGQNDNSRIFRINPSGKSAGGSGCWATAPYIAADRRRRIAADFAAMRQEFRRYKLFWREIAR